MTPPIRWGSLMTDEYGEFDYKRIRACVSVFAAVAGIAVAVWAAIWETLGHAQPQNTVLGWIVMALVLPVTGGTIATGIARAKLGNAQTES